MTLAHDAILERNSYARQPSKLPVVLSVDEVVRFREAIPSLKSRTSLTTVYAAGLRVSEVILLKIADVDSQRMNGKFRSECLNTHWFLSLDDARQKLEDWRRDYNKVRPHSAIGNKAPISLLNSSSASPPA